MQNKEFIQALGLLAIVVGACAAPAMARDGQATTPPVTQVMYQGVQVAIDPATGRLVAPTAAQRQALAAAMQPSVGVLRNGSLHAARPATEAEAMSTLKRSTKGKYSASMQVPESLMSGLVAETHPDGSVTIHHDHDAAAPAAQAVAK